MESVNRRVIVIAIVMALITSFLIYIYIKKATTSDVTPQYVKVFVAAKTMPPKYKITDSDLKEVSTTNDFINSKAVRNKADIVGKRLKDSIIEGEQILVDRLVDEKNSYLSFNVPVGMRAISVNVNEQIEVANLIKPGDFVDVIASFDKEEVDDAAAKTVYPRITKTLLQNVRILALGQEQTVQDDKTKELPKTVTLAVYAADEDKLVFASEYAVIRLALKSADDKTVIESKEIIRNDLESGKGALIIPKNTK